MGGGECSSLYRPCSPSKIVRSPLVTFYNDHVPQVSMLLTNHLSRTMEALVLSEVGASEGLQDALSLLLELGRSQMGKAILSQPTCVSKLLLLLTDQRYAVGLSMHLISVNVICTLHFALNIFHTLHTPCSTPLHPALHLYTLLYTPLPPLHCWTCALLVSLTFATVHLLSWC